MSRLKYFKYFRYFKTAYSFNNRRILCSNIHYNCPLLSNKKPDLKTLLENSTSFNERNPPSDEWHTPVYPEKHRLQSEKSIRLNVDPKSTSVILFPGQVSTFFKNNFHFIVTLLGKRGRQ